MTKWRGIALVGVGLLVAGAGLAAYALVFTGIGDLTTFENVNVVDRSMETGLYLVAGGLVTATAALVAYYRAAGRWALATVLGLLAHSIARFEVALRAGDNLPVGGMIRSLDPDDF